MVLHAPGTIIISFWLEFSSTRISAIPVSVSLVMKMLSFGMFNSVMVSSITFANVSVPIFVIITTSAPALCAATHWLNPFPPGPILNIEPFTVSPGTGRCGDLAIRSTTKLPNTATFFILFFLFLFSVYFLLSHFESGFFYLFSF